MILRLLIEKKKGGGGVDIKHVGAPQPILETNHASRGECESNGGGFLGGELRDQLIKAEGSAACAQAGT